MAASLQACGVVFPLAMPTSICRCIVTICSGLYLWMGMTRFSSKWILSHSTWYKLCRSGQLGMPAAHLLHTPGGHAPRRTDVAPGLEVSLRNILQNLLVQRQFRHQSLELPVFFFQFFEPLRLLHFQTAVFVAPAVERLHCDGRLFAGLWGGLSVGDADFNLPQHRHDLLWLVPLDGHDPLFLQVDSLSFHLVQTLPVRSELPTSDDNHRHRE